MGILILIKFAVPVKFINVSPGKTKKLSLLTQSLKQYQWTICILYLAYVQHNIENLTLLYWEWIALGIVKP